MNHLDITTFVEALSVIAIGAGATRYAISRRSVSTITSALEKTRVKLERHADAKVASVARSQRTIDRHIASQESANDEFVKARAISANLEKLLGGSA